MSTQHQIPDAQRLQFTHRLLWVWRMTIPCRFHYLSPGLCVHCLFIQAYFLAVCGHFITVLTSWSSTCSLWIWPIPLLRHIRVTRPTRWSLVSRCLLLYCRLFSRHYVLIVINTESRPKIIRYDSRHGKKETWPFIGTDENGKYVGFFQNRKNSNQSMPYTNLAYRF